MPFRVETCDLYVLGFIGADRSIYWDVQSVESYSGFDLPYYVKTFKESDVCSGDGSRLVINHDSFLAMQRNGFGEKPLLKILDNEAWIHYVQEFEMPLLRTCSESTPHATTFDRWVQLYTEIVTDTQTPCTRIRRPSSGLNRRPISALPRPSVYEDDPNTWRYDYTERGPENYIQMDISINGEPFRRPNQINVNHEGKLYIYTCAFQYELPN